MIIKFFLILPLLLFTFLKSMDDQTIKEWVSKPAFQAYMHRAQNKFPLVEPLFHSRAEFETRLKQAEELQENIVEKEERMKINKKLSKEDGK